LLKQFFARRIAVLGQLGRRRCDRDRGVQNVVASIVVIVVVVIVAALLFPPILFLSVDQFHGHELF
jgi:flagellin-like protein